MLLTTMAAILEGCRHVPRGAHQRKSRRTKTHNGRCRSTPPLPATLCLKTPTVYSSPASLLLLLAMGQGLFLSAALLLSRQRELQLANRLLAGLVLLFAIIIGHAWMGMNQLFGAYPHLASAIAPLPLLIGPLLWWYLQNLLHGRPLNRHSLAHGLPFAIAVLAWAPYYLQPVDMKLAAMAPRAQLPWFLAAFGAFKAVHVCTYLVLSYRLIVGAERERPGHGVVHSLQRLTLLLGLGLGLDALLFLAEVLDLPVPVSSDTWGAGVLTCFVYGLAYYAMRLPIGYRPPPPQLPPSQVPKPAESLLAPADRALFLAKLAASMEQDHVYRDGDLSLEKLAAHLALTPHELSQLVNQSLNQNFLEYVNGYRVGALQSAMRDAAHADTTILDLALAAGFNSKSSLNRVFKNHTGMTPSQFRSANGGVEGPK